MDVLLVASHSVFDGALLVAKGLHGCGEVMRVGLLLASITCCRSCGTLEAEEGLAVNTLGDGMLRACACLAQSGLKP